MRQRIEACWLPLDDEKRSCVWLNVEEHLRSSNISRKKYEFMITLKVFLRQPTAETTKITVDELCCWKFSRLTGILIKLPGISDFDWKDHEHAKRATSKIKFLRMWLNENLHELGREFLEFQSRLQNFVRLSYFIKINVTDCLESSVCFVRLFADRKSV